jgi:ATP-dependent RNA helicase DeaD
MTDIDSISRPQEAEGEKPAGTSISFVDLGLRPAVISALSDMGFVESMSVQAATIPAVRAGKDLLVQSRTGSGKTAAFAIPFADWIADAKEKNVQALVLLPTRELALQVAAETARISANTGLEVVPIYGGSPMGRQVEQLKAGGQIVCGTPGRILDHIRRGTMALDRVKCVVLDECDEMLSMGFQEDIETILESTPTHRQTLLFSATIPEGIQRLARRFLRDPETIKLSADFIGVHEIRHIYYSIPGGNRESDLVRILAFENPERAVIFCNTREETGRIAEHLRRQGLDADAISSDLSQGERESVMRRMRAGQIRFLVATDVAARGIDIENLPCVVNYTFPDSPEIYIHRTGRTGRAGRSGQAISLIGPTEVGSFYYLKLLYKINPEERNLPSEIELETRREGEKITRLRGVLGRDVAADWMALARRVMGALDGEQLVAKLLRDRLQSARTVESKDPSTGKPSESVTPLPQSTASAPQTDTLKNRAREIPIQRQASERERYSRDRPRGDRPRKVAEPSTLSRALPVRGEIEKEFWEIWSEDTGRSLSSSEPTVSATPESSNPRLPIEGGLVRLYVNLGKKDNLTAVQIAEHLSSSGTPISDKSIELMNTHCYVNVPPAIAEQLCTAISRSQFAGRTVLCEPARPPRRR